MTAPQTERQIDLRQVPPMDRHGAVFKTFDELGEGGALTLTVDHDPQPLRRQFEARNPGDFGWRYEERGPDVWKVRIEKTKGAPGGSAGEDEKEEGCCGFCSGG